MEDGGRAVAVVSDGGQDMLAEAVQAVIASTWSLQELEERLASGEFGSFTTPAVSSTSPPSSLPLVLTAVRAGHTGVCSALLRHGLSVNVPDSERISPLHQAAFGDNASLVELLLFHRGDPNARDCAGQPPLFFAASRPVCEQLYQAKADVNATNDLNQTALHLAAHADMIETLEWLACTVDPSLLNAPDSVGCTAADYAVRSRSKSTARLLRLRGAQPAQKWPAEVLAGSSNFPNAVSSSSHFDGASVTYKPARGGSRYVRRRKTAPHSAGTTRDLNIEAPVEFWKQEVASLHRMRCSGEPAETSLGQRFARSLPECQQAHEGSASAAVYAPLTGPTWPPAPRRRQLSNPEAQPAGMVLAALLEEECGNAAAVSSSAVDVAATVPAQEAQALAKAVGPRRQLSAESDAARVVDTLTAALVEVANDASPNRKVNVFFKIDAIQYTKMDASMRSDMVAQIALGIAEETPGINPLDVVITLSAGSVKVSVVITPPFGSDPNSILRAMQSSTSLAQNLLAKVQAIPNLDKALIPGKDLEIGPINVEAGEAAEEAAKAVQAARAAEECSKAEEAVKAVKVAEDAAKAAEVASAAEDAARAAQASRAAEVTRAAEAQKIAVAEKAAEQAKAAEDVRKAIEVAQAMEAARAAEGFAKAEAAAKTAALAQEDARAQTAARAAAEAARVAEASAAEEGKAIQRAKAADDAAKAKKAFIAQDVAKAEAASKAVAAAQARKAAEEPRQPTTEAWRETSSAPYVDVPSAAAAEETGVDEVSASCGDFAASTSPERRPLSPSISIVGRALSKSFSVWIVSADGIRNADWVTKSDPYCSCQILGRPETIHRTQAVKDSLAPLWNYKFELECRAGDDLQFIVRDKDMFIKPDDNLGKGILASEKFYARGFDGELFLLDGKSNRAPKLRVRIEVLGMPTTSSSACAEASLAIALNPCVKDFKVIILSARQVRNADSSSTDKSDPYCICAVAGRPETSVQTKVISNCLDPVWNQEFRVSCADGDNLDFVVKDKDIWPKRDDVLGAGTLLNRYFYDDGFDGEITLDEEGYGPRRDVRPQIKVKIVPESTGTMAAGVGAVVVGMRPAEHDPAATSVVSSVTAPELLTDPELVSAGPYRSPSSDQAGAPHVCGEAGGSWEVVLENAAVVSSGVPWAGLELADFRKSCQSKLNLDLGVDVLLVSGIPDSGQLALWNAKNPDKRVLVGDRVVSVNGVSPASGDGKLKQLLLSGEMEAASPVRLQFWRPPAEFSVAVKRRAEQRLGLAFKKQMYAETTDFLTQQNGNACNLLITQVCDDGAMAEHNSRQVLAGHWDLVVVPSMNIGVVNGVRDNIDSMASKLCNEQVVELRIWRSIPSKDFEAELPVLLSIPHPSNELGQLATPTAEEVAEAPAQFRVSVEKRGRQVGLHFKKAQSSSCQLLITAVLAEGLLAEYNSEQLAKGRWFTVVLPEMYIDMVNGIEGNLDAMVKSLSTCETLELRIRRSALLTAQKMAPGVAVMASHVPAAAHAQEAEEKYFSSSPSSIFMWEVTLAGGSNSVHFRVVECKELQVFLITEILNSATVAAWNAKQPAAAVKTGDYILEVNGAHSLVEMHRQLSKPRVVLRLMRVQATFEVELEKLEGGSFGFGMKWSNDQHLVVTEILSEGAVLEHNAAWVRGVRAGSENGILETAPVLPQMRILAVNGIHSDLSKMAEALRVNHKVKLDVQPAHVLSAHLSPMASCLVDEMANDMLLEDGGLAAWRAAPENKAWDVMLGLGSDTALGFETASLKERCLAKLDIDIAPDVLLISKVTISGQLPAWNACRAEAMVREGDRICEVNGKTDAAAMKEQLEQPFPRMRISRPPFRISMCLKKCGQDLGLRFRKSKDQDQFLKIAEVLPGGAVATHNFATVESGSWELLIMPGMTIHAVNRVAGNIPKMSTELAACEEVELHLQHWLVRTAQRLPSKQSAGSGSSPLSWDVTLPTGQDLGLSTLDFRKQCLQQLNVDIGEDVVLVNQIALWGQLAIWNGRQTASVVRQGDRIVAVDGVVAANEMIKQMQQQGSTDITMRIVRPMHEFTVRLAKHGQTLGIAFRTPQTVPDQRLLIAEILPEGAAATYNAERAGSGYWDRLILPNMFVSAVNGAEGNADEMLKLLTSCQEVVLQFQRYCSAPASPSCHEENPLKISGVRLKEWEVALNRQSGNPGFEVLDFREKCHAKLGLDIHMDVLLVSQIHSSGQLARWNAQNQGAMVRQGDLILEVDGHCTAHDMRQACQDMQSKAGPMLLRLARPPNNFNVQCKKSGRCLGLRLKKAKRRAELLITEVIPGSLVADYNAVHAVSGWERLVSPDMVIQSVNGLDDDVDEMMRAISESEELDLQVDRVPSSGSSAEFAQVDTPTWQVELSGDVVASSLEDTGLGFEMLDFRKKCHDILGHDVGSDILLVSAIHSSGHLSTWNVEHPEMKVQEGDQIVELNGAPAKEDMLRSIQQKLPQDGLHTLCFLRPPEFFNLQLEKLGNSLGLGLKKSRGSGVPCLLITELRAGGAAVNHNLKEMAAGRWDSIVLPDMVVRAVNNAAGDVNQMLSEISACEEVSLVIGRISPLPTDASAAPQTLPVSPETSPRLQTDDALWEITPPRSSDPESANHARLGFDVTPVQTSPTYDFETDVIHVPPSPTSDRAQVDGSGQSIYSEIAGWEVILPPGGGNAADAAELGFEVLDFRERCLTSLGHDIEIDVMLVSDVQTSGHLAEWNARHPEAIVQEGDRVLEVNGATTGEEIQRCLKPEMASDCFRSMRVLRLPKCFNMCLAKGEGSLGLGLKKSRSQNLQITEVVASGLTAEHNLSMMSAHSWELLVLPGMLVHAVNGVESDVGKMMKEIAASRELELKIERVCPASLVTLPRYVAAKTMASPPTSPRPLNHPTVWEVVLPRGNGSQAGEEVGLGFSMLDFKLMCHCDFGIDLSGEVLLVSDVCTWGQVSVWNMQLPEAEMRSGDRILEVNGESLAEEMRERLLHARETLHLRISRPSPSFSVRLDKQGRAFGLGFQKVQGPGTTVLHVSEVLSEGMVADYNKSQACAGSWELLLLPGMGVSAVNDVSGDAAKMLQVLSLSQEVELTVERLPLPKPAAVAVPPADQHNPQSTAVPLPQQHKPEAPVPLMPAAVIPLAEQDMLQVTEKLLVVQPVASSSFPSDVSCWDVNLAADLERADTPDHSPGLRTRAKLALAKSGQTVPQVQNLGCEVLDFRQKCEKVLNVDIRFEALSITKLLSVGRIATWNLEHPEADVRVGDLILAVNEASTAEAMQVQMQQCDGTLPVVMRIARPACSFSAHVDKSGRGLGLGFRNPRGNSAQHLIITDVLSEGAVAEYNSTQLATGRWDKLILPEMVIGAVNGIERDFDSMVKALSASAVVELKVHLLSNQAPDMEPSWEVFLDAADATAREAGMGLETLHFGEQCREMLGLNIGMQVLLVSCIAPSGLMATWNIQRPDAKVLQGDRVLAINGERRVEDMLIALSGSPKFPMRLQVTRPPWYFTARLEKGEGSLGLGFKKLQGAAAQHLLVTEVLLDGAVAKYNSAELASGCWDHLILPGMIIKQVNSSEGSWDSMIRALAAPGVLDVQLQRAGPSPSAPNPEAAGNAYPFSANAPEPPVVQVPLPPTSLPPPAMPTTM